VDWGYPGFFAATFLMCIPGLLLVRRVPLEREELDIPAGAVAEA
jgi:hypothetical protein